MNYIAVFSGVLLMAAPLVSQPAESEMKRLMQVQTRAQILEQLGSPRMTGEFGEFISMQFQIGVVDQHEFSHIVVIRKSDGSLVSITRNYEPEQVVDPLFPDDEVTVHYYPDDKVPQFSLRLRRLSGGRVLMAMGSAKRSSPTGQLVIMRESELRHFYPWLKGQLDSAKVR